jgi:phosphoenolpyruvate-protein kinase (PTS system EI component)
MSKQNTQDGSMPAAASAIVEGIAIGRASVWAHDPRPQSIAGTTDEEHLRVARAIARATRGVEELVRLLPRREAELFEPELAILGEVGPLILAQVDAGERAEDAVNRTISAVPTDLLVDARARLLDGLARDDRTIEGLLEGGDGDRVLVTEKLTPSVVASLPARVVGIVAAPSKDDRGGGHTSHAAILARGRVIPFVLVPRHVIAAIAHDDLVVLDASASPASVWVKPNDSIVEHARTRREVWTRTRGHEEAQVTAPLAHLRLEVHVNIGSLHEHVPASAEGVGLVRTELVFAAWTQAPSEWDQLAALRAIGTGAGGAPVVVRLFDAGDDKQLPWMRAPEESPGLCGIALLLKHPALLDTQLRAILRAAESADIRVVLPLVTCAEDVEQVRALTGAKIPVGAMIETPAAVELSEEIAAVSDFVCIGTNDLFARVTGHVQPRSSLSLDARVLHMIVRIVTAAHRHGRKVSVCGEMASEPHSARILVGLGVDAISVAPGRFARVKLSFRNVTIDDCKQVAAEALR